ncbi:hypothetical protein O181_035673 [Austropuccinia psidii MF-1]|uniref:Uncharacterized protein n=1 Tax=Austropuccinia psidii MF-1 TaxID=1389203 RepID=A0A9Q3D7Y3_9BASI|nr:hypothetical protein [Austropuccinia psidii MF-1]
MKKGNVIISHHVNLDNNIFPYTENAPSNQEALGLLFHDNPDPMSDQSSLLSFNPPTESRTDSLMLSSIETEHNPNYSSSIP